MELKAEQINGLIHTYMEEALEAEEDERIMAGPVESKEHHDFIMQGFESAEIEIKDSLMGSDYKYIEPIIDNEILKPNNIEADKDSYEYKKLCREFTKAQIPFIKLQMQRERGEYSEVDIEKIVSPQGQVLAPSGPTIGSLIDKWFEENTRAKLWKPRTHKQYTGHFTVMMQILGEDTPVDSIDHSKVRHIKDSLLKLPAGMNRKTIFKGKTIPEILEINKDEGVETLNVNTINGYIITLGAFFKWCVGNGYMTTNYADGAKIKVSNKKRPDEIRKAFTPEHLEKLFNAPEYTEDQFKESYQFWLPVLGLYTGARINELSQLRLDDIKEIDGIPCLVLQEDSQNKELSIKNTASMRKVPLHAFVAKELNFMGHVQAMRDKGETMGRYGKRYSVQVLYNNAVLKLDYSVDLEHLKASKWTE